MSESSANQKYLEAHEALRRWENKAHTKLQRILPLFGFITGVLFFIALTRTVFGSYSTSLQGWATGTVVCGALLGGLLVAMLFRHVFNVAWCSTLIYELEPHMSLQDWNDQAKNCFSMFSCIIVGALGGLVGGTGIAGVISANFEFSVIAAMGALMSVSGGLFFGWGVGVIVWETIFRIPKQQQ